jgi:hypothetical protein
MHFNVPCPNMSSFKPLKLKRIKVTFGNKESVWLANSAVSGALAEAGLDPEYLSASLVVDAKSFFQARQSS